MKKLAVFAVAELFAMPAVAFAEDVVPADPQGCHAIGGKGNSDGRWTKAAVGLFSRTF